MPNCQIWFNPKSYSHTALVVGDGVAYVGSPREGQLDRIREVMTAEQSPLALLGEKGVKLTGKSIRRIAAEVPPSTLRIYYKIDKESKIADIEFIDDAEVHQALAALEQELHLTRTSKQLNSFSAAINPAIVLLVVLGVSWFLSLAASEAQNGEPEQVRGRHAFLKSLFNMGLYYLGPTGVYVIGVLVGLLVLRSMYKRITTPPLIVTLRPS